MKNPLPWTRWRLRWYLRRLRALTLQLRRREGTLSFYAERGGPLAPEAAALAADLQCLLSDHLVPAADALERAVTSRLPLPEDDDGEGAAA